MRRKRERIFFAEPREHAVLVELFTARERERVFGHLPRPLTRAELERSIQPQLAPSARRRRVLRILESEAADRRVFCDVTDLCWACKWLPRVGGTRRHLIDFCRSCLARLRASAGKDALRERYAQFAKTLVEQKQASARIAAHLGLPPDVVRGLLEPG
jgi:hypothetical protein